jgi:hypothetical protein
VVVLVGETDRLLPVPASVPPQLPVYHLSVVPDPSLTDSVLLCPEQIGFGLAEAVVGATGSGLTVTVTLAQVELPQEFSQRA